MEFAGRVNAYPFGTTGFDVDVHKLETRLTTCANRIRSRPSGFCKGASQVSYPDPYFSFIEKGRKYADEICRTEKFEQYDCVEKATDHSDYDYRSIVEELKL